MGISHTHLIWHVSLYDQHVGQVSYSYLAQREKPANQCPSWDDVGPQDFIGRMNDTADKSDQLRYLMMALGSGEILQEERTGKEGCRREGRGREGGRDEGGRDVGGRDIGERDVGGKEGGMWEEGM